MIAALRTFSSQLQGLFGAESICRFFFLVSFWASRIPSISRLHSTWSLHALTGVAASATYSTVFVSHCVTFHVLYLSLYKKQRNANIKINIHVSQHVDEVWICRKRIFPEPFGAICSWTEKTETARHSAIFLGGNGRESPSQHSLQLKYVVSIYLLSSLPTLAGFASLFSLFSVSSTHVC